MLTNKRHIAFLDEYFVNGFNAGKAYAKVYLVKNELVAISSGSRLLTNADIQEEMAKRQALNAKNNALKRQELINDLIEIKNSQKNLYAPAALKAIELLLKANGWNEPDKTEHSGKLDFDVNFNIFPPDEPKKTD